MNVKGRLYQFLGCGLRDRQIGRTTRAANEAKSIGATMVVATIVEVKRLERAHPGLVVKSIETNLEGYMGPFIFDHHAVDTLVGKAITKIEELEKQNEALLSDNEKLIGDNQELKKINKRLLEKMENARGVLDGVKVILE